MTIKQNLEKAFKILKENNIEEVTLKAKILLANVMGVKKEYLIINENEEVKLKEQQIFDNKLNDLCNGKPLQYLTNNQEFYGINFYVNEDVLIPQPDTETLVEETIKIAKTKKNINILDLCTGSGCIAIALSKNLENVGIVASDVSSNALKVAKINDKESKIIFKKSNMFENFENEKFDIIVSNPPYIKENEIEFLSKEVNNEPFLALSGGKDGLDYYRIIAENAKKHLNTNGYLCLEIGDDQKEEVSNLLRENQYKNICVKKDLAGNDRVIICNV